VGTHFDFRSDGEIFTTPHAGIRPTGPALANARAEKGDDAAQARPAASGPRNADRANGPRSSHHSQQFQEPAAISCGWQGFGPCMNCAAR